MKQKKQQMQNIALLTVLQKGFIRSLGARAITYIGPRRGPTMLNRMWSEAELAVCMRQ